MPDTITINEWRQVWRKAPIGMAIVDREGSYRHANPFFCRMLGWGESHLIGMKSREITLNPDIDDDEEMMRRLFDGEAEEYTIWKRYVTKSGRVVKATLSAWPIFSDDGKTVVGVLKFIEPEAIENSPTVQRLIQDVDSMKSAVWVDKLADTLKAHKKTIAGASVVIGTLLWKLLAWIAQNAN